MSLDGDAVLVLRSVAEAQLDNTKTTDPQAPGQPDVPTPNGGENEDSAEPVGGVAKAPSRFHATVDLDAARPGPKVAQIAQALLVELSRGSGAKVRIRLDIEAEDAAGFPADVVDIVSDNARTLKIAVFGFELE